LLLGTGNHLALLSALGRKAQHTSVHSIRYQEASIARVYTQAGGHIELIEACSGNTISRACNGGAMSLAREEALDPMVVGVCDVQPALSIERDATRKAHLLGRACRGVGFAS